MNDPDKVIMTFSEFLAGAETSDSFEQVADEIAEEQKQPILIDAGTRRDEEWGVLGNQIVGRENLP
jgi:hypothetical protein